VNAAESTVTNWDQLPLLLETTHMGCLYRVSEKTISRWTRSGQIPKPAVCSGNIRRWDKEVVKQHIARRQRVG